MKKLFFALQFVFIICLNVNAVPDVCTSLESDYPVAVSLPGSTISRTFKPRKNIHLNEDLNFKAALFPISKSTFASNSLSENTPFYNLNFAGNIDITPGDNKFWDLDSNAQVIDKINGSQKIDSQMMMNFKDGNYYKTITLIILGQNVTANEYFYLADDQLYAKGMSIAAQTVTGSGITINVPEQEVLYNPSRVIFNFPITYDGLIHTAPQYSRTIKATVSGASALGIPDGTPVSYLVTFNDTYKVLSWGGLRLIDNEKPVNALLVQSESKTVGTIYINGSKATQEVLTPLKMTQDAPILLTTYSFKNMSYPDNLAEFGLNGTTVTYLNTIKTVK
ncbi:MAG: hypothetical protein WCP85_01565 [Mariniphaga sp.]